MASEKETEKAGQRARALLENYRDLQRRLNIQEERIQEAKASMYSIGGVSYDGMPRGTSDRTSRQERVVARIDKMERRMAELIEEEDLEYDRITSMLEQLRPAEETALTMRYLDGKRWNAVNVALFGEMEDFYDCESKYLKRVFKIHGSGLIALEKIMDREDKDATRRRCSLPGREGFYKVLEGGKDQE